MADKTAQRRDYEQRVNRALDYIGGHLGEDIPLDVLAKAAAFSPYHFHRVFTAMVGETVASFIRRVRLERAASDLVVHTGLTVTEVALRNGFASPAVFARAFRERFGMTASQWRENRKNRQTVRNGGEASSAAPRYALPWWVESTPGKEPTMEVIIEEMPALHAVYVRRMGDYANAATQAWEVLCRWAGPRGLLAAGAMLFGIGYDDPAVTAPEHLRYDACIAVRPDVTGEGQVSVMDLPARRVAKARYEGPGSGMAEAYKAFFRDWLPDSGFMPADAPALEVYRNDLGNAPERDHFVMDICVPVVPA